MATTEVGTKPRVDDLVIGILAQFMTNDGRKTFTADRVKVHTAFVQLKAKYSEELERVRFRDRGVFPESQELDQAICSLEAAGLLHRKNQTPLYYEVDSAIQLTFTRFVASRLESSGVGAARISEMSKVLHGLLPAVM